MVKEEQMDATIAVLGATGRTGRGIAKELSAAGFRMILVGRDRERLDAVARDCAGAQVIAAPLDAALVELAGASPAVIVNTVGPFERTAPQAIDALPHAHYLDLANDPLAARAVLDRHDAAIARGRTLVTGAGFGVLATESVALRVRGSAEPPDRVRVDAMAAVAGAGDALGEALAATIVEGIGSMSRIPTRDRRDWPAFGSQRELLTTPDGEKILTVGFPSGEWIAAARATGARTVFSASSEAPTSRLVPFVMPVALLALRSARLRRILTARLAATELPTRPVTRASWARATAQWADGTTRVAWLRAGDGMDFTIAVAVQVAQRLARGEGRPGAFTPGELFGAELAEAAGGTFL
jgi:short subunit dehydrogenase-like uncharacterized protein